jgi:hypothetical protein
MNVSCGPVTSIRHSRREPDFRFDRDAIGLFQREQTFG